MALLTNVLCLDSQHGGSRTGRLPRCARAAPTCDSLGTHYTDHAQHHRHDHGPADYGLDYDDFDYDHNDHKRPARHFAINFLITLGVSATRSSACQEWVADREN